MIDLPAPRSLVGKVEDWIGQRRDQLWAEAAHRYQAGERGDLPDHLRNDAATAADQHRRRDEFLEDSVASLATSQPMTLGEIARHIGLARDEDAAVNVSPRDQKRLGAALSALGCASGDSARQTVTERICGSRPHDGWITRAVSPRPLLSPVSQRAQGARADWGHMDHGDNRGRGTERNETTIPAIIVGSDWVTLTGVWIAPHRRGQAPDAARPAGVHRAGPVGSRPVVFGVAAEQDHMRTRRRRRSTAGGEPPSDLRRPTSGFESVTVFRFDCSVPCSQASTSLRSWPPGK